MNLRLYDVYLWLSVLLSVLGSAYLAYKYYLAVSNRPSIQKNDILFQEWFASGCSMKNILTQLGGASGVLRLVVTKDLLWVTSWFPFSLIAPFYDLEHVIPMGRITNIERKQGSSKEIRLTYSGDRGESHTLKLIPKDAEGFLRALGRTL